MEENKQLIGCNANEIFERLEAKPLNTKKNILDYIDQIKKLSKTELDEEQLKAVYEFIDGQIDAMSEVIKVNTLAYLKKELKAKLGKYAPADKNEENVFLHFYKETYKNQIKTKEYTWAMIDIHKIQDASVVETLKTINSYALKTKLTSEQKKDILPMIERIVASSNLKLINQVRSMEGIRKAFRLKIVQKNNQFMLVDQK